MALYFMPDPKLAELGLVKAEDQTEVTQAVYENYTRNALVQLRRIPTGDQIEEDHMRNRQMVVRWLLDHTKAIEVRQRDGKTFYVMTDAKAFHKGVGKLLAEVQRIKSEGTTRRPRSCSRPTGSSSTRSCGTRSGAGQDAQLALHSRFRHASADAGERRRWHDTRRDDFLSQGSDRADARVLGCRSVALTRQLERFTIALLTVEENRDWLPARTMLGFSGRPGGRVPVPIFRAVTGGLGRKGTGTSAALRSQFPFPHVLLCLETNQPCATHLQAALRKCPGEQTWPQGI